MNTFDPTTYGPVFATLLDVDRRRPLDEGTPTDITMPSVDDAFAHTQITDRDMARACLAGAYLLYDQLDASHSISQNIHTPEGSFWHGVMHRREGDFGNAKYWFRNVGEHEVYGQIGDASASSDIFDPFEFVDQVQTAVRTGDDVETCLDEQQTEWEALFDWCYGRAVT